MVLFASPAVGEVAREVDPPGFVKNVRVKDLEIENHLWDRRRRREVGLQRKRKAEHCSSEHPASDEDYPVPY